MTEKLFQFIWHYRLWNTSLPLKTLDDEDVIILHPGQLNSHAGPDFCEAKIRIGSTIWAGNIELHLKSSDWNKHLHQNNKAYSNLILHVVYEQDEDIKTKDDLQFPTVELKQHIDLQLLEQFDFLMNQKTFIPCAHAIQQVPTLIVQQQLDRMLAERLLEKTEPIQRLLKQYNNNWLEVFYIQLARGFGLHINQDIFEQLAKQTPLQLIGKHKHQLIQIEALLFGQAGFLNDYFDHPYPQLLQKEYQHLQKLYQLQSIEKHEWKFLRLRPANFPTLRIAQFAQLLAQSSHLFSKIIEVKSIRELHKLLHSSNSNYWLSHYSFNEKSVEQNKSLGTSFINTLIINSIVPTLFIYGKLQGHEAYCEKSIEFLKELKAEKNALLNGFVTLRQIPQNASESQAMLQLKKHYCDRKRCLECSIGFSILKKQKDSSTN